jgi:hypothetical protein
MCSPMTKYAAIVLFLSLLLNSPVFAQSLGYVFGAAGRETGYSNYFHGGIGGDWIVGKGFGVGGEVGGIAGRRKGAPNLALLSANVTYYFPVLVVDPFVTAGISGVATGGSGDFLTNWGGGANWWLRERIGLRFEFRDHVWSTASRHLAEFRFGVVFR